VSDGRARVLVVDDNAQLLHVLAAGLEAGGYEVIAAADGAQAIACAEHAQPDLILLDVTMPGLDGFAVCERLRERTRAPIIFLTARTREQDVLRGLGLGADDYIGKPFSLNELKARIDAKLRRLSGSRPSEPAGYSDGVLAIDLEHGRVLRRGQEIRLSPKQYQLLAALVRRRGSIVTHEELLREVWGAGYESERGYLALYVRYLREAVEEDPSRPERILTHHGVGYSFAGQPADPAS